MNNIFFEKEFLILHKFFFDLIGAGIGSSIIKQTPEEPTNYGRMAFTIIVMPFLFIWFFDKLTKERM